ncbi:ATP-binding cassette domain-containing protein [Frankia sp. Cr2]|uniref:ATP-binding cassette domain-containing protein n=1 Tax=Frankia sp. Cr2 TaxID=3073932 RepID=UPI002AD43A63|nr:ATP-binding cassette domain-containing protein [Frankia sp. Cr2]
MSAISAQALTKVFTTRAGPVHALDGLDLEVAQGTVLGLLGPNGAGKTTTVRILATLLRPDSGRATVLGYDVVRDAQQLRRLIGLSGQYAAVDENLTAAENLWMFGRLYQLPSRTAHLRAGELLEQFALSGAADSIVKTYSGGMRRRLDLASALIGHPRLLFLDEPTTGLDPRSRVSMWNVIRDLVREGSTLLLTTQYLEEADALADVIAVVDTGKIIARGTAAELKSQVGGERVEIVVNDPADLDRARDVISRHCTADTADTADSADSADTAVGERTKRLTAPADGGMRKLTTLIRALDEAGIVLDDFGLRRPTLDDVFLRLTGHAAQQPSADGNSNSNSNGNGNGNGNGNETIDTGARRAS